MKTNAKQASSIPRPYRQFRRSLLTTACALALSAGASAQTLTYSFNSVGPTQSVAWTTDFFLHANQVYDSFVLAPVLITGTAVARSYTGPGTEPATTIFNNMIQGLVTGSYRLADGSTIGGLGVLGTSSTIGLVSGQTTSNGALTNNVTASNTITSTGTGVAGTGTAPSQNTISNNTTQALTTLNDATQTLSGAIPAGYSSAATGSATATGTSTTLSSTTGGSILLSNNQSAFDAGPNAGSTASVSGSTMALTLTDSTAAIASAQTLDHNTLAAQYVANTGTTTLAVSSGSAPLAGSAVVTNLQSNVESASSANPTAIVTGSGVQADLRDLNGTDTDIAATVTVSNNTIGAASTGNTATSSIALASGVDLAGPGTATLNNSSTVTGTTNTSADLAVMSLQRNDTTALTSTVTGSTVRALADNVVAGGSVLANSNAITAGSTGNTAANSISTGGNGLVNGTIASTNYQENNATNLAASITAGQISADIGSLNAPAGGLVNVGDNRIEAATVANSGTTNVSLAGTSIAVPSTATGALAGTVASASTTGGVGASLTNAQANLSAGSTLAASVTGSNVYAAFSDQSGGAGGATSLDTARVNVDSNTIAAAATSNTAQNTLALGTSSAATAAVDGAAGLASSQQNASSVSAMVTDSGVSLSALDATNSTLAASANTISSNVMVNDATNALSVAGTNVTATGVGAGTAATATSTGSASAGAAYSLANAQANSGVTTGSTSTTGQFAVVNVGGAGTAGIDTSMLAASQNTVSSKNVSSQASNALTIDATNLSVASAYAGQVANLQNNTVTGIDAASVSKTGGGLAIGILYDGPVAGSKLTVSGNTVIASAAGNTAGNSLAASVQNFASGTAAAGTSATDTAAGTSDAAAGFAVVNNQFDSVSGGRTASVTGMIVGADVNTGGDLATTKINVDANTITADARNNNAVNNLSLADPLNTNLTTTGGLTNAQSSATDVSSFVGTTRVRIQAAPGANATVTDSALTVQGNTVKGIAVGNAAANTLQASAQNLVGDNAAGTGLTTVTPAAGTTASSSDFVLNSSQQQTGDVGSTVRTSMRINYSGMDMSGGSATITGNGVQSIAQANSVSNQAALSATNLTGSAAVNSFQNATGAVSAVQNTQGAENATFGVIGGSVTGTQVDVTGNTVLVSAGQNESFNRLVVAATNLAGQSYSLLAAFDALTGLATASADYLVNNVQTGVGSVSASAQPGLIGTRIGENATGIDSSNVTVSGNGVTAKAGVNTAVNALVLNSATGANVSAVINSGQIATAGTGVSATVSNTTIGLAAPVGALGPVALNATNNGSALTVSGNNVLASGYGNTASNSLSITGGLANGSSAGIANTQYSNASISATVSNVLIGGSATIAPSGAGNTAVVSNNNITAQVIGNSSVSTLASH
jgi:hypothetical protein